MSLTPKQQKIIFLCLTGALLITLVAWLLFDPAPETESDSFVPAESSEYKDMIKVTTPKPGAMVSSPLTITGEARGPWFFEASFPIVVTNWDGLIIGEGFATAQGDWMTEDYVPFTAEVTFTADTSVSDRGSIILQKSNASGLPEHDDAFEYEVRLSEMVGPAGVVEGSRETTEEAVGDSAELTGSAWEWVATDHTGGVSMTAPAGEFVLTFSRTGTLTSTTDCNSVNGTYTATGGTLSVTPGMSTLMFCEGSLETEYRNDIHRATAYEIDGNQLRLHLKEGAGTMRFVRAS